MVDDSDREKCIEAELDDHMPKRMGRTDWEIALGRAEWRHCAIYAIFRLHIDHRSRSACGLWPRWCDRR